MDKISQVGAVVSLVGTAAVHLAVGDVTALVPFVVGMSGTALIEGGVERREENMSLELF